MNKSLINIVKYSKFIYSIYFYLGSFLLRVLRFFVTTDEKLIVFVSFGGRKYDDSPRCIYEKMIEDDRFKSYHFVWAFMDPQKFAIPVGEVVKIDTLHYYLLLLKARCWITNSSVERGLSFSGKHTYYLNTWHGTPIKKMGIDVTSNNKSFGTKSKESYLNVMLAQGQYDIDIFSHAYNIPQRKFCLIGLPRNDELVNKALFSFIRQQVCNRLEVPINKQIILYAPTFREYTKDKFGNPTVDIPINVEKWSSSLSDRYVVLFRAHYEITKKLNVEDSPFWKDVSTYGNLNELMIASDLLISDYSSIFFDYAILEKPMLCFAYDYEDYRKNRGLYFDIRKELMCAKLQTEDDLINELLQVNSSERILITQTFKEKYIQECGNASIRALDLIMSELNS